MLELLTILWEILTPIFLIIFIGYVIQKMLHLDLSSLTQILFYMFIPSLIFINIATSELDGGLVLQIFGFTVILFFLLMVISFGAAKITGVDRKKEKAFMNAVILRNQGNFGIPLVTMLFAEIAPNFAISIHMIVLFATNLLLNTVGLYNSSSGSYSKREAFKNTLKLPMIYMIVLGFIFKGFAIPVPPPIESSLRIMGNGTVPTALFTLGAQLANTKLKLKDPSLSMAVAMRLVLSPVLAWLMTLAFGITGIIAQVLIIGAAAPTAVNSVLLALAFDGDAEYASETVFLTTLLCALTVTATIYLVM